MKVLKRILALLIIIINTATLSIKAQSISLNVGDQLPEFKLRMINHSSDYVELSKYKGKILVLDFWSTWCTVCIQQFPHVKSLQTKYSNDVIILPVTSFGTRAHNLEFFQNRRKRGIYDGLASAVEATALAKAFNINALPTEVWIGRDGKVLAITDGNAMTEYFINKVIKGENLDSLLRPKPLPYNFMRPMLVNGNGAADSLFTYRSILTKYIPGFDVGIQSYALPIDSGKRLKTSIFGSKLFLMWTTFSEIYNAENKPYITYHNRIVNESKVNLELNAPRSTNEEIAKINAWKAANEFNYELILPSEKFSRVSMMKFAFEDLTRFFNFTLTAEKRKVKCLILTSNDKIEHFRSPEKLAQSEVLIQDTINLKNFNISSLVSKLNNKGRSWKLPPVINESKIEGEFDFKLSNKNIGDKKASLITELEKMGISLKEDSREITVFVFRDKY